MGIIEKMTSFNCNILNIVKKSPIGLPLCLWFVYTLPISLLTTTITKLIRMTKGREECIILKRMSFLKSYICNLKTHSWYHYYCHPSHSHTHTNEEYPFYHCWSRHPHCTSKQLNCLTILFGATLEIRKGKLTLLFPFHVHR